MSSPSTFSNSSLRVNGNRGGVSSSSGGSSGGGGIMRNSLKILFIAVLSFIGGMQIDRGFIVQIYFDDSRNDAPALRSEVGNNNKFDAASSTTSLSLVDNDTDVEVEVVVDGTETQDGTQVEVLVEDEAEEKNTPRGDMSKPVEKIVLLGERHGGTNWITDHLAECFGDRIEVRGREYIIVQSTLDCLPTYFFADSLSEYLILFYYYSHTL
jgi:hypothetical protein